MNLSESFFQCLKETVKGDLHTDRIRRYLLSTDGSIFCSAPACVVYPRDASDVAAVVRFAGQHGVSVHPRGAGSGVCGSALGSGICMDFTRYMNALIHLDIQRQTFECEPGYRPGELEAVLKGTGLFFPPDPSSSEFATFGGMYATNASGAHSVKYGNVADYIEDADIVIGNGGMIRLSDLRNTPYDRLPEPFQQLFQLYRDNSEQIEAAYPDIACNVCGYRLKGLVTSDVQPETPGPRTESAPHARLDLRRLFAGSEGTLGVVTRLKFRLIPKPGYDSLVIAFFDSLPSSARAVRKILPMGPSGIEIMDKSLLNLARESDDALKQSVPDGIDNVLMIEFDSDNRSDCEDKAVQVSRMLREEGYSARIHTAVSEKEKQRFWAIRKAAVPILYRLKGSKKAVALIEDAAVPSDHLEAFFNGLYDIFSNHGVQFVIYGHIAKGLLHARPLLNLKDPGDIRLLKVLADGVFDLVRSLKGTISGEHGDGRLRSGYIRRMYPDLYDIFLKTKQIFDANRILNPDIKTGDNSESLKKNLRFGDSYRRKPVVQKKLIWKEGFEDEAEKCHGCSKCTAVTSATRMCPVYKVTRDEIAAPKAKANILRGVISGAVSDRGMCEEYFQAVTDACIRCGSCYSECPSGVNIPKLALEAQRQHEKKFGKLLLNQALTSPDIALKTLSKASGLQKIPGSSFLRKTAERSMGISSSGIRIRFSDRPLSDRLRFREGSGTPSVLYFPGCYASYVKPEIGTAAVTVLKQIGFTVITPPPHCCGLPAMTKGDVDKAAGYIRKNLRQWRHVLNDVSHVVVTCSSCGLSLLQEWQAVTPVRETDIVRKKLIHISALVNRRCDRLTVRPSDKTFAYHLPCHLKAQPGAASSLELLTRTDRLKVKDLKSLCCGMAGTWGLQARNAALSRSIGSDLIRKLDDSGCDAAVTDCPTCAMQIQRFTQKKVFHPIEIINSF